MRQDEKHEEVMEYFRDPQAIYTRSFEIIRSEADLSRFSAEEQTIAIRMIHACGMTELVDDLVISPGFVAAALVALRGGKPTFVDAEMVKHGIIARTLPAQNEIICTLNDPRARDIGMAQGITRSAAAVELWLPSLEGALVAIGNAPTALFHLLELVDSGGPRPAALIACPVGFVGAAESKAELAANPRGIPFVTVRGRRGGSAMAAAVVNALTGDMP
jgi:precorrin-8X/cobalt-precorrin-8 methylmutase